VPHRHVPPKGQHTWRFGSSCAPPVPQPCAVQPPQVSKLDPTVPESDAKAAVVRIIDTYIQVPLELL
jgi:hypothetical protein